MKHTRTDSWVVLVILSGCVFQNADGQDANFYVNVAYGKPATQSSTYLGNPLYNEPSHFPYNAFLAVDGNTTTNFHDGSCSHTDVNQQIAWWEVDLQGLYEVASIKIYQRSDANQDWLEGIVVRGKQEDNSYSDIYHYDRYAQGVIDIALQQKLQFKAIRIQQNRNKASICLCEVEVFADVNECITMATPCHDHGQCSNTDGDFSCLCDTGYTGKRCEIDIDECATMTNACHNHGQCDNTHGGFTCSCNTGYTGNHCENDVNECKTMVTPCHDRGQCSNTDGDFSCHCDTGYTGKRCEIDIDECSTMTRACHNHGQCSNTAGSFSCRCSSGYTGSSCESVIRCNELQQADFGIRLIKAGIEGNWTYHTTVAMECYPGYSLNGDYLVECTNFGQWNGTLGNCSVIRCNELPQADFGIRLVKSGIEGNWTYHTTVAVECCTGYSLNGDSLVECTDHGQWNGTLGNCSVIRCNELAQPEFGTRLVRGGIEGNWTYNTTVAVECFPGYSLNGDYLVECINYGEWNGTLGNCSAR